MSAPIVDASLNKNAIVAITNHIDSSLNIAYKVNPVTLYGGFYHSALISFPPNADITPLAFSFTLQNNSASSVNGSIYVNTTAWSPSANDTQYAKYLAGTYLDNSSNVQRVLNISDGGNTWTITSNPAIPTSGSPVQLYFTKLQDDKDYRLDFSTIAGNGAKCGNVVVSENGNNPFTVTPSTGKYLLYLGGVFTDANKNKYTLVILGI